MPNTNNQRMTQSINNKLASRGLGTGCRVNVQVDNGQVTLSGTVQYAHQKGSAVKAIAGLTGIRRVIDQLTVKPAAKRTDQ